MIEATMRLALNEHLQVLSVSEGIEPLLGFSPELFLSAQVKLRDRIHPDDQDIADLLFTPTLQNACGTVNFRLRQAHGRILCVKGHYQKSTNTPGGELVLDLLLQDVKGLPRTLSDASMTANFRAMMENTDDFIYFKDRNHVLTGASQTLVTVCEPAEHWTDLVGKTDYDVFPEDLADLYYRLEKQIFAGLPVARETQETRTNEGRRGWIDNRKYPIRDEAGDIIGLFGIARDITERKGFEDYVKFRNEILEVLASEAPLTEVLTAIVLGIEVLHPAMLCSILLLENEGKQIGSVIAPHLPAFYNEAINGLSIGMGMGSCGTAAFTGERVIAQDIATHPYWVDFKELAQRAGLGACWSQPIYSASHQVLGTFAIYHRHAHQPDAADTNLIEQAAHLASIAIEKSLAEEKLRDSEERYRLLVESSTEGICVAEGQFIKFCNPALLEQLGYSEEEVLARPFVDFVIAEDRQTVQDFYEAQLTAVAAKTRHQIRLVSRHKGIRWFDIGTVKIQWNGQHATLNFLTDITERKSADEQIRNLAYYDSLTQLPNRRMLQDHLSLALASSKRTGLFGTLMMLDLDNFKPLNDEHGHAAGDLLLIEVAKRILGCVREVDTVARLGGDEFVVVLSGLHGAAPASREQAMTIAEKIRATLAKPYVLKLVQQDNADTTIEHQCSASIGITLFAGQETSQNEIVKRADDAMYQAKESGRNTISFFG